MAAPTREPRLPACPVPRSHPAQARHALPPAHARTAHTETLDEGQVLTNQAEADPGQDAAQQHEHREVVEPTDQHQHDGDGDERCRRALMPATRLAVVHAELKGKRHTEQDPHRRH